MWVTTGTSLFGILLQLFLHTSGKFPKLFYFLTLLWCSFAILYALLIIAIILIALIIILQQSWKLRNTNKVYLWINVYLKWYSDRLIEVRFMAGEGIFILFTTLSTALGPTASRLRSRFSPQIGRRVKQITHIRLVLRLRMRAGKGLRHFSHMPSLSGALYSDFIFKNWT